MIAPETEAMFVERFLQREATSKQTIAVKAEEKAKGHDWVVPCDTVGCTEIIAVCHEIRTLEESLVNGRQDLANTLHRAKKAEVALAEAIKVIAPFAAYGQLPSFDKLPANWPVTNGSSMAARQLTAADIQAASAFAAKHGGRDG